jgi:putative phosphoribosyl transferase
VPLTGRTALIVDDGLATGATATVACQIARELGAAKVVLAVPVAPRELLHGFPADEVIAVETPYPFHAVGMHYRDFGATSDAEVQQILERAVAREASS